MAAKQLAFRYLYKSGVIKENTVTVFGELGQVFMPGTDYDEEVNLEVPYMELSNLIMYYTGTVADGTVGSTVEGSLRNLNAPASNVRKFKGFSNVDHDSGASHYYIGDIVLFDPVTGNGESVNASCWTCAKTTTDLLSPIPELANEIGNASKFGGSATSPSVYHTRYNGIEGKSGPGMTGIDNRGQRFISGVLPALYDPATGDITINPYWRESALAKSYLTGGNYYQGEIVIFNGAAYQCKSTNGFLADPQLYQRTRYTVLQEQNDAAGVTNADPADLIPPLDPALAPSGAFGYDSSGTRYLMGVPPAGGLFSALFWEPATLPKTPSGAYLNINWDNTAITDKLQFYDANVVGGSGAQSIPTFTDDAGNTITTLRKIYDDNEKSFVLTIANQILASIPAAAIKSQAVNSRVEPDNTLVELVNLGPTNSKPSQYTPAVQGLFEESIARDMLRISGYDKTITEIVVTDGASGYFAAPPVRILGGLATNPKLVPFVAKAVAKLGVKSFKINKQNATWPFATTGKRYGVGDVITLVPLTAPDTPCLAKVYRVDSDGNILSIIITDKGSGYKDLPTVTIAGDPVTFLEPVLEVVSVDLQYSDTGFYDGMKVVVQYGSGAGAVGRAVTSSINNQTRLTEVRFDPVGTGTTHTDTTANETYTLSRGLNYVAGNFKKDVVALQGFSKPPGGTYGALLTARSVGVVTKTQGSVISELVVINNGSGYTSNPIVSVDAPAVDVRDSAKLVKDTTVTPNVVKLTSYLPPIESRGVYTDAAPPTFTVADAGSADAKKVQGKSYLGLNVADVKFGGSGFSQGEYLSVTGGGVTPASFSVSHSDATGYSALVLDGGDDYSIDKGIGNNHFNEFILKDDSLNALEGDELRAEILTLGGGIVDIGFNNGRPSGQGFALDDIIEVTPVGANAGTKFRFTVTSVGPEGTIAPTGYEKLTDTVASGYTVGQTLVAESQFFSIDTLTLPTAKTFTGTDQPTVSIPAPTGSSVAGWAPIAATAKVSLKVNSIQITSPGSGYQQGDVVTVTQTGARSCEAYVLALRDSTIGSIGVLAVVEPGANFDISKTGADAVVVNKPTTTGTPAELNVVYEVESITVTNPGVGYQRTGTPAANPVVELITTGAPTALSVTTKKAGGSTATFQVSAVEDGKPMISQLSPGTGYIVGDLLTLKDGDGNGVGAYVKVTTTQSRGVRAGTMIAGYRGTGHVIASALKEGSVVKVGSPTSFPNIQFSVRKVTPPKSISSIRIIDFKAPTRNVRYANPTALSHKPHARVKVGSVDAGGSILTLIVEHPGYGYKTLPTIKPRTATRGTAASLFAVSLGISRVEFTGAGVAVITGADITVVGDGIVSVPRKAPARAIAQLAGDLNMISTDPVKNPNILETLELLKPGSTTGYAQAKPNMGVSSVTVVNQGRGYKAGRVSGTGSQPFITYIEVTPPDLPNGVLPEFTLTIEGEQIKSVAVTNSGRGYSKLPKALVKMRTNDTPTVTADVTLNMKLLEGYITSGGEGYLSAPSVTVVPEPDLNVSNAQVQPLVTMKTSINGFVIADPGAQFLTTPEALVVGPGNLAEATAAMGVSDIYVVNGGTGYAVGDMLVFSAPTGLDPAPANATVQAVGTGGVIQRVGLVRSEAADTANRTAIIAAKKNSFNINGGAGFLTLPTVTKLLRPDAVTPLYVDDVPNSALPESAGTGATFTVRLGVSRIDFTTTGEGYESDATILIQDPPSSQQANYSAVTNAVGQVSGYVRNSTGSGYTRPPGLTFSGAGAGARATPIMGVTEVAIIKPGSLYQVGDLVTFTGGNPIEPATGVVTVTDRGGSGIGYDLNIAVDEIAPDGTLSVDSAGKLVGSVGAITKPLIIEGGYEFSKDDVISLLNETRLPSQEALNSLRAINGTAKLEGGKLTKLRIANDLPSIDFKAGMIMKVTPLNTGGSIGGAVAYIRINIVLDDLEAGVWRSVNPYYDSNGGLVSTKGVLLNPGDKYGQIKPALYYDYDNAVGDLKPIGLSGEVCEVLASNAQWGSDPSLITSSNAQNVQKLKFEVLLQDEEEYPGSRAFFKVTQVLRSVGAILLAVPCDSAGSTLATGVGTGKFYSVYDLNKYTGTPKGRVSFIQVLNPGRGYQSNPVAAIANNRANRILCETVATLGVVDLRIDSGGSGYSANPTTVIEPPNHRALTAKAYARSAVFDMDVHDFEVLDQGAGYTGKSKDAQNQLQDGGTYRLVGGALHQTGGSAESIDSVVTIKPAGFSNGKLLSNRLTLQTGTTLVTTIRGSNYRIGDVLSLVPIGTTTSDNQAKPATIRVKQILKSLDHDNGMSNNADEGTGTGILDYGKKENGEDVGGYGTGYFEPPFVTVLGGNQGVTLATSLGLVAVDLVSSGNDGDGAAGGTNYEVGDLVQMVSPEFSEPVDVGVVSRVTAQGQIQTVTIYEPYSKGLNAMPSIIVERATPVAPATRLNPSAETVDATLTPVLGVTVATTTTSSDGFIGRPYVFVAPPNGRGFIQQPRSARVQPIVVNEVTSLDIRYDTDTPEYTTSLPRISIAPPPTIEKYSGWRSVRFSKNDSFEAIVQYTIAKAISFQVDPDATLPGYYFTAQNITIGGVNIPLRQSGGKGMQGRELSANRIIRRYKIKLTAI